MFKLAFVFLFVLALLVVKLPFPRRFKAWLVALVSLTAVALVSIAPMMCPRAQSPPTAYEIIDLGLVGGTESKAFAINSCGQVAGYATFGGSSKRPFFRPSNSLIDLGVLSGNGTANSVNSSGYVVGNSPAAPSNPRAFIWHDDNGDGDSDAGEMRELLPIGATGAAEDINDNGKVVGWIDAAGDSGSTGGYAGFTWENNNFQTFAPGVSIKPFGINNAGTIVGVNSDTVRAFVLRSGVFTPIGSNKSIAYAVSEADPVHVVGTAGLGSSDFPTHAFIWTDAGGLKDLGTLSGRTNSDAYNVAIVSNSVQVVGTSYNDLSDAQAFVWQDLNGDGDGVGDSNEMKDLLLLVSNPGDWTRLTEARSINSSGQIVGFGTRNGETHAFLLTPPSGPPSACLPTVNVSVSPAAVNEDGVGPLTYTFTRSITTGSPLVVSFSTTGTAVANDYAISAVSNVQIPANMSSVAVTVTPMADTTDEPNETVTLTITPDAANYTVGTQNAGTGTITDDDGTPTIQIAGVTAPEPASGSITFDFIVSLTNPSSSPITVNYATDTTGATATGGAGPACGAAGVDFLNNNTSTGLTFAAGETSKQVSVTVCSDSNLEPDETFFVNLSGNSPNSVLLANTKGTGTITPQTPAIFTEEGNVTVAAAVDSVTFARGPFPLVNNLNFSEDRLTRIILVTSSLGMTDANLPSSILSVHINGYANPLPIEHVGPITGVSGLNASYIIVKLPADLPTGSNTLTVKMGGAQSNAATLSIIP
ncbi:MAG: Calx-beta domain-containing protein [Pyrinomonadaceae bacterium]